MTQERFDMWMQENMGWLPHEPEYQLAFAAYRQGQIDKEVELAAKGDPVCWVAKWNFDNKPLGAQVSFINLGWKDQVPLYAAPQAAPVGICQVCGEDLELPQDAPDGNVLVPVEPKITAANWGDVMKEGK